LIISIENQMLDKGGGKSQKLGVFTVLWREGISIKAVREGPEKTKRDKLLLVLKRGRTKKKKA